MKAGIEMNLPRSLAITLSLMPFASVADVIVVDQSFAPDLVTAGGGISSVNSRGQTFTVGRSGQLVFASMALGFDEGFNSTCEPDGVGPECEIDFSLRKTVGGAPSNEESDILASLTLPWSVLPTVQPSDADDYFLLDLRSFDVSAIVGEQLALVVSSGSTAGRRFNWVGANVSFEDYLGGQNWFTINDSPWLSRGGTDIAFQTFVRVPEPGTLALLGIGLFGMGLIRRRKRHV